MDVCKRQTAKGMLVTLLECCAVKLPNLSLLAPSWKLNSAPVTIVSIVLSKSSTYDQESRARFGVWKRIPQQGQMACKAYCSDDHQKAMVPRELQHAHLPSLAGGSAWLRMLLGSSC
eukprot:5409475-Amphidinium_carterae.1